MMKEGWVNKLFVWGQTTSTPGPTTDSFSFTFSTISVPVAQALLRPGQDRINKLSFPNSQFSAPFLSLSLPQQ
jgi:hypothetical protein